MFSFEQIWCSMPPNENLRSIQKLKMIIPKIHVTHTRSYMLALYNECLYVLTFTWCDFCTIFSLSHLWLIPYFFFFCLSLSAQTLSRYISWLIDMYVLCILSAHRTLEHSHTSIYIAHLCQCIVCTFPSPIILWLIIAYYVVFNIRHGILVFFSLLIQIHYIIYMEKREIWLLLWMD